MPRASKKKHRLPRRSEEKRATKYPNTFGLDFSLPMGDRDEMEEDILASFYTNLNPTKENYHE